MSKIDTAELRADSERIGNQTASHVMVSKAKLRAALDRIDAVEAALQWYQEQAANCCKIGPIGYPARQALDKDRGERARQSPRR